MFKLRFTATLLAFSAIAGLQSAVAQQDNEQPRQRPAAAAQDQDRQPAQQPQQNPTDQPQSVEARRIPSDGPQQGLTMTQALVKKLHKANNAEIELAQMAQQKTDNQQIKQLAQTIIKDHQAFNKQLEQLVGAEPQGNAAGNRQPDRVVATTQVDPQSPMVPQQLVQLMDQACDNALKMTKEMLQKQEGQDFQMAFLGQQAVAHTQMLAELKAIQSSGPEQLQQIAEQAIEKTQQHLEQTKQLAMKLEDKERPSGQRQPSQRQPNQRQTDSDQPRPNPSR